MSRSAVDNPTLTLPLILGDGSSVELPKSVLEHSTLLRCMAEEAAPEEGADTAEEPLQLPVSAGLSRRGVGLLAHYLDGLTGTSECEVLAQIEWPSLDAIEFTRAASFLDVQAAVDSAVGKFGSILASCESTDEVELIFGCDSGSLHGHRELESWISLAPLLGRRAQSFVAATATTGSIFHRLSPDVLQSILRFADKMTRQDPCMSTLLSGTGDLEDALIHASKEGYRGSSVLLESIMNQFDNAESRVRRAALEAATYVAELSCCRHEARAPQFAHGSRICVAVAVAAQLADGSKRVRREAVRALDTLAPATCAFERTSVVLKHRSSHCRAAAASAYPAVVSDTTADVLMNLVPLLEDGDSQTQQAAAKSLGKLAERCKEKVQLSKTIDAVARLRHHRRPAVRAVAIEAMAQMSHKQNGGDVLVKTLLSCIKDKAAVVRSACAKSLASVASVDDLQVGPALVDCLTDPDVDVREQAVASLKHITDAGMDGSSIVKASAKLLSHHQWSTRVSAMSALVELMSFVTCREVEQVRDKLSDLSGFVRLKAAQALAKLPSTGELQIVDCLLAASDDDDEEVRAAAIKALRYVAHPGSLEAIRGAMAACHDSSCKVQAAAFRSLTKLASGGQGGLVVTEAICSFLQKSNSRHQLQILDLLPDIVGEDVAASVFAVRALQKLLLQPEVLSEQVLSAGLDALAQIAVHGGEDSRRCARLTVKAFVCDETWIIREAAENAEIALLVAG